MKILIIFFIGFVYQLIKVDTLVQKDTLKEISTIANPVKIETVKVLIKENNTETSSVNKDNFQKFLDELVSYIIPVGWKILLVLLIVFMMGILNYKINQFYNRYNLSSRFKHADLIKVILHILIWTFAIIFIVFVILRSSTILILTFLASIFIVLVISISDLAKNLIGGILILIDRPFDHGDWIKIGEYAGKVHSKNLRTTDIITEDDSLVKIPNQLFIKSPFENLNVISKNKQLTFVVEVPPKEEISKIKNALFEIVSLSIYNSIGKPVEVIYKGVNTKGNLEFSIRAYVFDAKYESEFKSDVQERVAEIFGVQ